MEKRELLDKTFQTFVEVCFSSQNMGLLRDIVVEDVVGIGSAIDEKIFGFDELIILLNRQKEQSAGLDMRWEMNTLNTHFSDDANTAIYTCEAKLFVTVDATPLVIDLRLSTVLEYRENKWQVVHWHGSKPEAVESEKDTWGIENWKEKAVELEKQVAERTADLLVKNHELAIEAALERVRAVAMSMKKPADMLDVCKVIAAQLQQFGVDHIRNVQLAIINESKGQYICYQYFPTYDQTTIEETQYHKSPVEEEMVRQMLACCDGHFIGCLAGEELDEFRLHRREVKQFHDPLLDEVTEISYAFLSIGEGGLGLSLYRPMEDSTLTLFKRFHQVFNLAYQRFRDIQQAEAQARESEIQLALERVRARTMAMQKSEELPDAAQLLFQQVQSLGMPAWSAGYAVFNPDKSAVTLWMSSEGVLQPPFTAPTTHDELFIEMRKGFEIGNPLHVVEMGGEKLVMHYEYMRTLPVVGEILDSIVDAGHPLPDFQIMHQAYFSKGFLLFITYEPVTEAHEIFIRFANVFEQTYTRFLDLQKAEVQAKEAQVDAAMERIRARAMAMHTSGELVEVAQVLREQMGWLNQPDLETSAVLIYHDDLNSWDSWYAFRPTQDINGAIRNGIATFNKDDCGFTREINRRFQLPEKDYTLTLSGAEREEWIVVLRKAAPEIGENAVANETVNFDTTYFHFSDFSGGSLLTVSYHPPSEEIKSLQRRAASVFDLAYTRFLDLKKAEAQAREARIEVALEKVRSRSMAMHKSEELKEVIQVVYEQLVQLDIPAEHTGFIMDYRLRDDFRNWIADKFGTPSQVTIPYFDCIYYNRFNEAKKKGINSFSVILNREEKDKFYRDLFQHVPGFPEESKSIIFSHPGFTISTVLLENVALYIENFTGIPFTDEEDDFLMRFGRVFQQTYTRFLDLQKAEAQAREAQIEAALERVRSKAMAMQYSGELSSLIGVIYTELNKLDVSFDRCFIMLFDAGTKGATWWMASPEAPELSRGFKLPYHEHPPHLAYLRGWEERIEEWLYIAEGEEKRNWDDFIFTETELSGLPEEAKAFMRSVGRVYLSASFNAFGCLTTGSTKPLTKEAFTILMRFARVFETCYSRFNDLQKAEAHAREASIEAALERVRSRSLAMHKSEELSDLSLELVKQVQALGVETWFCAFNIYDDDANSSIEWGSNGQGVFPRYRTPRESIFLRYYEAGQRGETLLINEIDEDHCPAHYEYLCSLPGVGDQLLKMKEAGIPFPAYQIDHVAYFKHGYLLFITYKPVPETYDIFKRFAKVFEQSYTRFLDLKKAEEQAKEAAIELGLERVRARAMAMQHSDELAELVSTVFMELNKLDFSLASCIIWIHKPTDKSNALWIASEEMNKPARPLQIIPFYEPFFASIIAAWKEKDPKWIFSLTGNEKEKFQELFFKEYPQLPEALRKPVRENDQITFSASFNNFGALEVVATGPLSDEKFDILHRFGKVFNASYTRFNDLQKAEAQAREAQIEVGLERVRSRAMAMHSSDELQSLIGTIFTELNRLDLGLTHSVIWIIDPVSKDAVWWMATGNDLVNPARYFIPFHEDPPYLAFIGAWQNRSRRFEYELSGNEKIQWDDTLFNKTDFRNLPEGLKSSMRAQEKVIFSGSFYNYGGINIANREPLSEEHFDILLRFAKVFDLTYTRFLDLKNAEVNAREAIRRASIERVRGEVASMRTPEDLQRITPLIWNELTALGVPFFRCGVFIVQEQEARVQVYLSTPAGKSIARLNLAFGSSPLTDEAVNYWRVKKVYKAHWGPEDFRGWVDTLMEQGQLKHEMDYTGGDETPEHLCLHFIPFTQGMLYVGSVEELGNEQLLLVEALAGAFATAYARYEDFNKLEAAKQTVEAAMDELKATQVQLVQQEKLASLGQLTAGIAHEIKNPLNFINNFSDVSVELIDEVFGEISAMESLSSKTEILEILENIRSNLKIIHQHGTRADGIVKSMLMHSRTGSGRKEPADLNALIGENVNLAFHGMRAAKNPIPVETVLKFDESVGIVPLILEDFSRVILNLCNNAYDAMREKLERHKHQTATAGGEGGLSGTGYIPVLSVSTKRNQGQVLIVIEDNGTGIPAEIRDKILQPFFTTKKGTQGTGLGLSITHDIIKAHGGLLEIETESGFFTRFIIKLL